MLGISKVKERLSIIKKEKKKKIKKEKPQKGKERGGNQKIEMLFH